MFCGQLNSDHKMDKMNNSLIECLEEEHAFHNLIEKFFKGIHESGILVNMPKEKADGLS